MAWQYAGQVSTHGRIWGDPIPVFAPQLRLTYSSINPAVLKTGFYGWLRIVYTEQGIYSERWDRIWPKPQQELVTLAPWEPTLGQHAVQFRQGGRYLAVDDWSVTVEYWVAPGDPDGTGEFLVGDHPLTVDELPIEF